MYDISIILVSITVATLICYMLCKKSAGPNIPSPKGYPLIGPFLQIAQMGLKPHILFEKWAKELGEIYSFNIFGKKVVILNSVEIIYEALVKKGKDFSGREPTWRLSCMFGDSKGQVLDIVLSNPNTAWAKKRKIAQKSLKMFGEGMVRIQDLSLQYVDVLVQKIKKQGSEPFDPRDDIYRAITGMMYTLVLGVYIDDQSQDMLDSLEMEHLVATGLTMDSGGILLDIFPFLRHFKIPQRYREVMDCNNKRNILFDRLLKDIKTTMTSDSDSDRGLADALFRAQQGESDILTKDAIYAVLTDMTAGGVETSSTTFCALLHILSLHPEIQTKIQEEISTVLGNRDFPRLADKDDMPYARAAVLEVTRYFCTMPILLPHCAAVDSEIRGYHIPKDTVVIMNAWYAQHDESYWDEPYRYKPERFIDSDGKLVLADHPCRKGILTFGAGVKACIGEVLAMNRLFLFLVTVLRHFDLKPDPEGPKEFDVKTMVMETVLKTSPYKIIAMPRN